MGGKWIGQTDVPADERVRGVTGLCTHRGISAGPGRIASRASQLIRHIRGLLVFALLLS